MKLLILILLIYSFLYKIIIDTRELENEEFRISSVTELNGNEFIRTDEHEYTMGMQYFSLNVMDENKEYVIEKLDYFKKLKEDPNFLGYIVNIARVSYIINLALL